MKEEKLKAYNEGYSNGLYQAIIIIEEMSKTKNLYLDFGKSKIPFSKDQKDFAYLIQYNVIRHLKKVMSQLVVVKIY